MLFHTVSYRLVVTFDPMTKVRPEVYEGTCLDSLAEAYGWASGILATLDNVHSWRVAPVDRRETFPRWIATETGVK
jgi:hypothetical protein